MGTLIPSGALVSLKEKEWSAPLCYNDLKQMLQKVEPGELQLYYIDDESDRVAFSSQEEYSSAFQWLSKPKRMEIEIVVTNPQPEAVAKTIQPLHEQPTLPTVPKSGHLGEYSSVLVLKSAFTH